MCWKHQTPNTHIMLFYITGAKLNAVEYRVFCAPKDHISFVQFPLFIQGKKPWISCFRILPAYLLREKKASFGNGETMHKRKNMYVKKTEHLWLDKRLFPLLDLEDREPQQYGASKSSNWQRRTWTGVHWGANVSLSVSSDEESNWSQDSINKRTQISAALLFCFVFLTAVTLLCSHTPAWCFSFQHSRNSIFGNQRVGLMITGTQRQTLSLGAFPGG